MESWLEPNKKRILITSLVVVNILIWNFYFSIQDKKLHLKVYDVGQGDAIFIKSPKGFNILIDGGPNQSVIGYLSKDISFYSRKIDLLILTHPQADHMTGLLEVVKRYQIKTLWISAAKVDTRIYQDWIKLIEEKNINYRVVYQGEKTIFPDGTKVEILWPKKDMISDDINSYSVVTLVSYGEFDALLTGDADKPNQPYTSSESHVEVFKVPHHGSRASINKSFVATILPDVSIISVGKNMQYGHPNPQVIKFLEQTGSKVYRTDKNGTVEIVSDGKSWYTNPDK